MRALKIRSTVAGHGKVTKNNREPELILSQLQEKLPQNSTSVILRLFGTCSKLEGEKAAMTSSVFGPRRSSKALAKAKLVPKKKRKKKVPVTVWWSATRLVYCSFLYPCETITYEKCAQQIDEMHQKLQCLQPALVNRKAQFFSSTTPSCTLQNQHFKTSTNWATRLRLLRSIHLTSHRLTTTSSSILATFFRENASTTSRRLKMLCKGLSNHEA